MPRRKKADSTAAPSEPRKRRRRKNGEPTVTPTEVTQEPQTPELPPTQPSAQDPALAEAERELTAKYPHVQVIPGSLRPGAAEGWGGKRVVDFRCVDCGAERTRATSDLWHSDSRCAPCSKAAKKAAKKKER